MLLPYELARWRTVRALLALVRREAHGPHLLFGDFNAARTGERIEMRMFTSTRLRLLRLQARVQPRIALRPILRAGYVDCFRRLHPAEPGLTWMPTGRRARGSTTSLRTRSMARRLRDLHRW